MKKTLIVVSSNREWEQAAKDSVKALRENGAKLLSESGSSCVTFARNRALSFACEHLRGAANECDVVLMMDDDMDVSVTAAMAVVSKARASGVAASAAYATVVGTLAGTRWDEKPGRWLAGCGCLAIPAALLLELERESDSFEMNGKVYSQFTWTQAHEGKWIAEDFRLSMRLGGVFMLPVGVGHIKKWPIWPDESTLGRIAVWAEESESK